MVKLQAPILSIGAAGRLVHGLHLQRAAGGARLQLTARADRRRPPAPALGQVLAPTLARTWPTLTQPQRDTWTAHPDAAEITPYGAFRREAWYRFLHALAPSKTYPADPTADPFCGILPSMTGATHHLYYLGPHVNAPYLWAIVTYATPTTAFTYDPKDAIAVHLSTADNSHRYYLLGLTPGTYHIKQAYWSNHGRLTKNAFNWNVTVTD